MIQRFLLRRRVFLLGLPLFASCATESSQPPNVLIITLDTLRADHLSCYGYDKPTTPHLDQLADTATRYANCMSTAPWTVPSHASIMTGRFPSEHGAISTDIERKPGMVPWEVDNVVPLGEENITLAEVLRDAGYATAAFVANVVYLRPAIRIGQGFDSWVLAEPWLRKETSSTWSPELTRRSVRWLEEHVANSPKKPFLLFLNYMDTHRPYNIAPESAHASFNALEALHDKVMVRGLDPRPEADLVIEQFDRGLSLLDNSLGELFAKLKELGLFEDMLIIVTSDHGEFFGEHGLVEHSKDVYQETLHVPLIIKLPGQSEARVDDQRVSLVDLARVVLEEVSGDLTKRYERTFPYRMGEHPIWAENHFSRARDLLHETIGPRFKRRRFALFEDSYKFILSSDKQHELYDLDADPDESNNLAETRKDLVERMQARGLKLFERARKISANVERLDLTPEEVRQMEASGYAGGDADEDDSGH